MPIEHYRTAWGLVGNGLAWPTLDVFARATAHGGGYHGVEFAVPLLGNDPAGQDAALGAVKAALGETGLAVMPLIATRPGDPRDYGSYDIHIESFRAQLELAVALGAPRAVVHGGADAFSRDEAVRFFAECAAIAADAGVLPMFETHRGRPLNDPWRTAAVLDALPELKLTSDLSHWMPVVDRWPEDIMDLFDEASRRSAHVHARVGHEKGPQVPDPRDPIWEAHVELHRRWWSVTVEAAGDHPLGIAPEFGPPPYMNAAPFTQEPAADLVEVNAWMRAQLGAWFGEPE